MPKTIKMFATELTQMHAESPLPFDPFIQLCLAQKIGTTKDGFAIASPKLASEAEVDHQIKCMKDDLDSIAKSAKIELRKSREKTQSIVKQRAQNYNDVAE